MRKGDNQDGVSFDSVNDAVRELPQKFSAIPPAHSPPKFRERSNFFPRTLEFVVKTASEITGSCLVKRHRVEYFQLRLK